MLVFQSHGKGPRSPRQLDVRPDETDSRDYLFQPALGLLPATVDPRPRARLKVLNQGTEGACVGHALAAVINLSFWFRGAAWSTSRPRRRRKGGLRLGDANLASERMLYEMARRYDEWKGEHYEGTSLRGVMKGWHKHGVCSRALWRNTPKRPGHLDEKRAADARRRPLGAYYRIADSDVTHMQAAIVEGDAVLASAWIHSGWRAERLQAPRSGDALGVRRIPYDTDLRGLHAFAIVGYGPEGFLVQNSWGGRWGSRGLAILAYDDWFENRQDAWVARPAPETWDRDGAPDIFLIGFQGRKQVAEGDRAGTSGAEGLEINPQALPFLINTGDRGELSVGGRLQTRRQELSAMARLVRQAKPKNGVRNVVLYAHGGLVSETAGARTAAGLWSLCQQHELTAYFFVWETGFVESFLGMIRSQDDATGPRAGWSFFGDVKDKLRQALRKAQYAAGEFLAPFGREQWKEMKGRARGASAAKGGGALFATQLFQAMEEPGIPEPFTLHLVGHSAGSIFLAELYDQFLQKRLQGNKKVQLSSVQFLAPALSIPQAQAVFAPKGTLPVKSNSFRVFALKPDDEENDSIGIYPSSLLTYVADHLESENPAKEKARIPLLGIDADLRKAMNQLGSPTLVPASVSDRHQEFDEPEHEIEDAVRFISP